VTEPAIGAPALERHRTRVADVQQQVLASLDGAFDVRNDFASVAAISVLSTLLGVPPAERPRLAALCAGTATTLDATLCSPHLRTARELMTSITTLRDVLTELIEAKRRAPGDDLVSALLRATAGEESPANDVLAVCTLLTVVGVEMTTNLICEGLAALLDHPDQWARFRADPDLAADVVEETLRYAPPVRLQSLLAQEDIELAGTPIEAGGQVVVAVGAANRDPDTCADPDRFDITRGTTVEHLSLCGGLYTGLVAPAARLQAVLALRAVAATVPDVRRTDAVLRRLRSPVTGAVLRFPAATE
jgi:P450-derived glycosyltransferase activator